MGHSGVHRWQFRRKGDSVTLTLLGKAVEQQPIPHHLARFQPGAVVKGVCLLVHAHDSRSLKHQLSPPSTFVLLEILQFTLVAVVQKHVSPSFDKIRDT